MKVLSLYEETSKTYFRPNINPKTARYGPKKHKMTPKYHKI